MVQILALYAVMFKHNYSYRNQWSECTAKNKTQFKSLWNTVQSYQYSSYSDVPSEIEVVQMFEALVFYRPCNICRVFFSFVERMIKQEHLWTKQIDSLSVPQITAIRQPFRWWKNEFALGKFLRPMVRSTGADRERCAKILLINYCLASTFSCAVVFASIIMVTAFVQFISCRTSWNLITS